MEQNQETRSMTGEMIAVLNNDGKRKIVGYAALFNKETELMPGLRERIAPGAFDDVLQDDVRALFNHDPNIILARSPKTLTLTVDEKGLRYEFTPPNTTDGNNLLESIERGDVNQSSFGFSIKKDSFERRDGAQVRTIEKVKRLYDISPVTYPAYQDTTVALRNKRRHERGLDELERFKTRIQIQSL